MSVLIKSYWSPLTPCTPFAGKEFPQGTVVINYIGQRIGTVDHYDEERGKYLVNLDKPLSSEVLESCGISYLDMHDHD